MMPDPLTDLIKLGEKYQILTELHHCSDSRTYLARDLERSRDVTITVARAAGDRAFLQAYAAGAEILRSRRPPNIIPVREGMWLGDDTFALVRARIRGSTLEQTVSAVGTMPADRIAAALDELTTALIWARDVGITSRCVEPETLIFQQGSGRVLLGFEPSPLIAGDAETIEAIGRMMNGGAPLDVSEYTARLGMPRRTSAPVAAVAAVAAAGAATAVPVVADRQVGVPVGSDVAVVERPNRGMSFIARVLTTFGVVAALVIGFIVFRQHRNGEQFRADGAPASGADAAGDVAPHSAADTAAYSQAYPSSQIVPVVPPPPPPNLDSIGRENEKRIAESKAQARAMSSMYGSYGATGTTYPSSSYPTSTPYPSTPYPSTSSSASTPYPMPSTPTRRPAIDTSISPTPAMTRPATDSLGRPELLDPCGSPIGSDQSQCLSTAIEKADRGMSNMVQRAVDALRREAGVAPGDPDPASVADLRDAQHRWQQDREDACRAAGSGAFYAKERAACYAGRAAQRKAELQRQIDAIP
jgi:uncharacterized protein YecT (DUF1311 family)